MTAAETEPRVYTPDTLAAEWQVSGSTVRNMIKRGQLRAVRFGSQYRILRKDVEEYLCTNSLSAGSMAGSSSPGQAQMANENGSGYALRHAPMRSVKP